MKTATEIKRRISPVGADQRAYALSEPLDGFTYVVVSAVNAPMTGPETLIFGADKHGQIKDYLDLDGSFRGALDHEEALRNAGYEIASTEAT